MFIKVVITDLDQQVVVEIVTLIKVVEAHINVQIVFYIINVVYLYSRSL